MKLFDTDAVVELLRRREYKPGAVSIITLIEVLRGLEAKRSAKIKELIEKSFQLLTINNRVIMIYCKLYQSLKEEGMLIPDADLLIAATSISHNIPLKTKDKHFQRLQKLGLKLTEEPEK